MLSLLQAVTNSAGSALTKESAPTSIKSAWGAIGANLFAAAGSIGIAALAKKALGPGAAAQYTPAAQSQIGAELARNPGATPTQNVRPLSPWKQYKPALIVAGIGLALVVGAYAWHKG